jgi:hypothetical protein
LARSSTTWQKGRSGNPGGREKRDLDIEKLARAHGPAAIATLVAALKHPKLCVQAASVLLDRGYGRPKQNISGDKDRPLIVDFKWADNTSVVTATENQVIDAVAEQIVIAVEAEAEPALVWEND